MLTCGPYNLWNSIKQLAGICKNQRASYIVSVSFSVLSVLCSLFAYYGIYLVIGSVAHESGKVALPIGLVALGFAGKYLFFAIASVGSHHATAKLLMKMRGQTGNPPRSACPGWHLCTSLQELRGRPNLPIGGEIMEMFRNMKRIVVLADDKKPALFRGILFGILESVCGVIPFGILLFFIGGLFQGTLTVTGIMVLTLLLIGVFLLQFVFHYEETARKPPQPALSAIPLSQRSESALPLF